MPRLSLTHRGTYALPRRPRTSSPVPRGAYRPRTPSPPGDYRISTALSVLPPGRAAQEIQKLTENRVNRNSGKNNTDNKEKQTRAQKLAAVRAALVKHLKKSDSLDKAEASPQAKTSIATVDCGPTTRGRSRSRTKVKVVAVKNRSRSRSRSNTRLNAVVSVKTTGGKNKKKGRGRRRGRGFKGGFSCVSARSRSCTPERNLRLRVQPIVQMPSARTKPDGPVPLKGTGLFIFQDKENLNPQRKADNTCDINKNDVGGKSGRKLRMWSSFRKKVKAVGRHGDDSNKSDERRSQSVREAARPGYETGPRLRRASGSSCTCSCGRDSGRDTSSSTYSSGSDRSSVFSQLSMSPPELPSIKSRRLTLTNNSDRENNNNTVDSYGVNYNGNVRANHLNNRYSTNAYGSKYGVSLNVNNDIYACPIQNRPLPPVPPVPVPRDSILNRRPSLPNRRRRTALTSVSSSSSSSSCGSTGGLSTCTGGLSSGYGSLPRVARPNPPPPSVATAPITRPPPPMPTASIPRPPPPPPRLPPPRGKVTHLKTIKLDKFMSHKWVTGIAYGRKGELVVVDLCGCYVVDPEDGSLKRQIGVPKSGPRTLHEPIDVTVMTNGNLVVSDHADQGVKIYTSKGQYLRTIRSKGLSNIAGVATNEQREILVAGTDRQCITRQDDEGRLINVIPDVPLDSSGAKSLDKKQAAGSAFGFMGPPDKDGYVNVSAAKRSIFEHPYSVATNPLTGDIIVGDDYRQLVTAVSPDGKVLWKYCPQGAGSRAFFPSSICVDPQGYIFIADLYNEKVYMLDSSGKYLKTLLSRGEGLKGGPGAIAVDGRGVLVVADEEKSVKLFQYAENGFALSKRFSVCPDVS